MTAVAAASGASELGNPVALTRGFSSALAGAAVLALLGAILAAVTLRGQRTTVAVADPAVR